MPAKSEKQKKFFGAVMGAKKGKEGPSGKAKEVAKDMPKKEIKKFLKTEEEDEEHPTVPLKRDKEHPTVPLKRDVKKENTDIVNFIEAILLKNYASANKYIKQAVESRLQEKIEQELQTPLF